jgi:hypothetical protein
MEPADRIPVRRRLESRDGHRKRLLRIRGRTPSDREQLIEGDLRFAAVILKVFVHDAGIEQIDSGRDAGVGREDVVGSRSFQSFVEGQLLFRNQHTNPFQREKRRMPLVHVIRRRLQPQRLQRAQAADSQDDFLTNTGVTVTAVKLIGDLAMIGAAVLRNIGIEQVQLHPPGIDPPDF